jgi:large subunit ribosomal protein L14
MIQKGTVVNVIDNSGAKKAECIHLYNGYRRRYAKIGDIIKVAIKRVRKRNPELLKIKKGDISRAVIVRSKSFIQDIDGRKKKYNVNLVVLISEQNKYIGTRLFTPIDSYFRKTKQLRLLSLAPRIIY